MRRAYARQEFEQVARLRYLGDVAENQNMIAKPCAVSFWHFAIPAMLAGAGSAIAGVIVKRRYDNESSKIQEAAVHATKFGAFWLIGGFTWIVMCKRTGVMK
jgi:hypothetical protein